MKCSRRVMRMVIVFGLVGMVLGLSVHPAFAGWRRRRRIIVAEPAYVLSAPVTTIQTVPTTTVVSAPVPTVYSAPVIRSAPVPAVYSAPVIRSAPVPAFYAAPVISSAPVRAAYTVPSVILSAPVVRPVAPVKVIYPRRVYRFR